MSISDRVGILLDLSDTAGSDRRWLAAANADDMDCIAGISAMPGRLQLFQMERSIGSACAHRIRNLTRRHARRTVNAGVILHRRAGEKVHQWLRR